MASYRDEDEHLKVGGPPSLHDLEPGKPCGAVLPMSDRAQTQMRDRIEVIEYLLNRERVIWT